MVLCRVSKKTARVTLWLSAILLILFTALLVSFHSIYDSVLKTYITLGKGSLVTKIWEDIPLPIYEKLYFFNITNSEAFLNGLEPLNVTEVGPYTFRSRWTKKNPKWSSNHTVSYRERRTYHFVPELSSGSLDDVIFTLNGPMIMGANYVPSLSRIPFSWYCRLKGESVVTKNSIRELAYEGYEDPLMTHADFFTPDSPYIDGKFSWLYGKNNSDDGIFTVFTGTDDESKTDLIYKWNGKERLSFWQADSCNMINGSSIETGPPIKGHPDSYTFFQSIFCRSLTFSYTEEASHYNILAKRFRPTYDLFANSTENPDNDCFETKEERASGVLDVSSCQFDAPVLISFPHFYMADPAYLENVNGLQPNDEKHGSYIDVEPITGISVDLTVRFQINLEVNRYISISQFKKLNDGIYPVFWIELSLKIDENLANFLKNSVQNPKIIGYSALGAAAAMSLLAIIMSILCLYTTETIDDDAALIGASNVKEPFPAKRSDYSQGSEVSSEKDVNSYDTKAQSDETSPFFHSNEGSMPFQKKSYDSIITQGESAILK